MTGKKVKKQDHEKLTPANIAHVISLMEAKQPITKKAACEILNISYNTTRLSKIIEEYKDNKAYEAQRREKNRGKPAEQHEIQSIVELYLLGDTVSEIAKRLYRPTAFVNNIIERIGVPTRPTGDDRYKKAILPEQCVTDDFVIGQIVWSAKYHATAKIMAVLDSEFFKKNPGVTPVDYMKVNGAKCYKIHVSEKIEETPSRFASVKAGGFFANALSYDLGSLEHLKQLGINLEKL